MRGSNLRFLCAMTGCIAAAAAMLCAARPALAEPLPGGAAPLAEQGDFAEKMVEGLHRFLDRKTAEAIAERPKLWHYDFASAETYAASVAPNRERFRAVIGLIHPLAASPEFEIITGAGAPAGPLAKSRRVLGYRVRWPALDGVEGEGLLLLPMEPPRANVIALPDADESPEAAAGLIEGAGGSAGFALRLAEAGFRVLVPSLVSRSDEFSANPAIGRATNQPGREFIYRMAYELGSHVIGYEVEKVLAAADCFARLDGAAPLPLGVAGYGEGGLLALYAAAAEPRIAAALVSGYFRARDDLWIEPIYRNVWRLAAEFGDAELAGLIAPRPLAIEASRHPEISGPPPARDGRGGAAPGATATPPLAQVRGEFARARTIYDRLGAAGNLLLAETPDGRGEPFSSDALNIFCATLSGDSPADTPRAALEAGADAEAVAAHSRRRSERQFKQLVDHLQKSLRLAQAERAEFWKAERPAAKDSGAAQWAARVESKRRQFHEEVIGAFPPPDRPPSPRMRLARETPSYRMYQTVLDVWEDAIAYGLLLVPADLKEGERRPVVVCQHGLEGRPEDAIDPANPYYQGFAARLAELGYVVYAPQNPYIGQDKFRSLQRKANPLGKSLFSIIIGQHAQTINWLETLPFADPKRIAFYGLSYGGKTAMRVPAIETRYCLSICSADFNEWIVKNAAFDSPYSYLFTGEYEMFEFNLGRAFNYAEMAWLIAPRPFMVERGHYDGVAPDDWVAAEFARVKFLYDELGIGPRAEMEVFLGPHTINGQGTFEFLSRRLAFPARN